MDKEIKQLIIKNRDVEILTLILDYLLKNANTSLTYDEIKEIILK